MEKLSDGNDHLASQIEEYPVADIVLRKLERDLILARENRNLAAARGAQRLADHWTGAIDALRVIQSYFRNA